MSTLLSQLILYRNILREIEYAEMDGNLALLANAIDALGGGSGGISLDSPEFTGTPKAPTAAPGTNRRNLPLRHLRLRRWQTNRRLIRP